MFKLDDINNPAFTQQSAESLRQYISPTYCLEENQFVQQLIDLKTIDPLLNDSISSQASALIEEIRNETEASNVFDKLLLEYSLDTEEGILLMCLAEALLRIPDEFTADALIADRLANADWDAHIQHSDSLLVNTATWGLLLTGKLVSMDTGIQGTATSLLKRLLKKMSEPLARSAIYKAMEAMGGYFVLGRSIKEAIQNGAEEKAACYSFDMLGEAASCASDAERYLQRYRSAIRDVSQHNNVGDGNPSSVSIKLSALHPRYEEQQRSRVMTELYQTCLGLFLEARKLNVDITLDAEEMDRFELYLDLFEKLYQSQCLKGWKGFGLVIQAYSKRAIPTLLWLCALAKEQGDRINVRLVKGAYWDSEIKWAQQAGLPDFPVFTRKESTDLSFLACARFLLTEEVRPHLFPQFATHNAYTVLCITEMATHQEFEFQRLHGMGGALYQVLTKKQQHTTNLKPYRFRTYAPVGEHAELLPYLVRRLLENGANASFVHQLADSNESAVDLVKSPTSALQTFKNQQGEGAYRDLRISLPSDIFRGERRNSTGQNLNIEYQRENILNQVSSYWEANEFEAVIASSSVDVEEAISRAEQYFQKWNETGVEVRAACLESMADLLEENTAELMALCQIEAGKTLQDSIEEIREAVDFCRYYSQQASKIFCVKNMQGTTGESNQLYLHGTGVFACISPWNFPVAIFVGQVAAALVAGNCVLAKPAEQTSRIAERVTQLFHQSGIPEDVLQLIPGEGERVGDLLTKDERIAGVAFTGSFKTAKIIQLNLAKRQGAIATLVAETGGQNAMIVDSTALPEQVVRDVIHSAFNSAGQRCSALRVLFVQEDVCSQILKLLKGAMAELVVGEPYSLETDIGPVIDATAKKSLQKHINMMYKNANFIYQTPMKKTLEQGLYIAPIVFQIGHMSELDKENFGPILHVISYRSNDLDGVIDQINQSGYRLTLGIHSRNRTFYEYIDKQVNIGNIYVNRNQVGATVGVQAFGGTGFSGTGPKAGGPNYLLRFASERSRCINTSAIGGNTDLLSM